MSEVKVENSFRVEMGKMISRPHRLFLLLVMFLLGYSGVMACQENPQAVFEATLAASKWVLGIIGGFSLAKSGLGKKVVDGVKRSMATPPSPPGAPA